MTRGPITLFRGGTGEIAFDGEASPAPGGGSMPVQVARIPIENADILTLPSAPVEIVATPGPGKMLLPISAFLVCDTTAGAILSIASSALLGFDPDGTFSAYGLSTVLVEDLNGVSFLLNPARGVNPGDPGALSSAVIGPVETVDVVSAPFAGVTTAFNNAQDPTAYEDKPLLLAATNGGSDFTDGDAANTLTVTVFYAEVTL